MNAPAEPDRPASEATRHPLDERLLAEAGRWVRGIARRLQTNREHVGKLRKVVLATVFVPPFALWLIALRLRVLVRGPIRVRTTTDSGIRLDCRPPDLIQMLLYLFGIWEPDLTAYLRGHLQPGRTFIDVGANIGYFSLEAARLVGPEGHVVAIEAAPWIHEVLERHVRDNELQDRVRVVNKAVSDCEGSLELFAGPAQNVGLTTTVAERGLISRGTVDAAPLGALLEPQELRDVQIIKIDVEGAEVSVLEGMRPLLEQLPDDVEILLELSPAWWPDRTRTPDEVLAFFYEAGFHAYTMENNYWPFRYLWPQCCRPPRRAKHPLRGGVKRIDLLLTRRTLD